MDYTKWLVQFDDDHKKVTNTSENRIIDNISHMKNFLTKHFGNEEEVLEAVNDGYLVISECQPAPVTYTSNPILKVGTFEIGEL